MAEIEAEYEKVKSQPVKPSRLLKSQQAKKVLAAEPGSQIGKQLRKKKKQFFECFCLKYYSSVS